MTNDKKLEQLRSMRNTFTGDWIYHEGLDYAIQCVESIQSRAKTLRYDEITVPGIYLAKYAWGMTIPTIITQEMIDAGQVHNGAPYQGPIVWEAE